MCARAIPGGLALALVPLVAGCLALPAPRLDETQRAALQPFCYRAIGQHVGALRAGTPGGVRVIYVHGTPGDAESWSAYLAQPVPGTESIALDRPGFGRSDSGAVRSLAAQAAAIAPLLGRRGGRLPILVGHSLGGPIVARVAVDHPDAVGALVIVSGSLDPALEARRWYNVAARALGGVLPHALHRANQEVWGLRAELEELAPLLAEVRCPVVIVHGARDELVPYANVDFMRTRFTGAPRVEVLSFEDADHFLIWRQPWAGQLRALIARLAAE